MSDLGWVQVAEFTVFGTPKAQPRPRFSRKSGHAYNPPTAKEWKAAVQAAGEKALLEGFDAFQTVPFEGPVKVDILFFFKRPKRLLTKSSPLGAIPHTQKPDRDNLDKAVLDALGKAGWFKDDAQVCSGEIGKCFLPMEGKWEGAIITISMMASAGED